MESTDEVYANLAKENNVPESLQRMATDHYQKMVNYNAWRTIALSSSDTLVMEAHREIHDGQQFFLEGRTNPIGPEGDKPSEAQAMLESGMTKLALMLVKYPVLATHDDIIERGIMATEFYVRLHELNGVALPDRYPLKALRESHPDVIARMTMRFNRELAGMR